MEVKLTIGIPTYNRSEQLDQLLSSIEIAWNNCKDVDLSICISDNCSPDNTALIVSNWANRLPIDYLINEKNVGFIQNLFLTRRCYDGKGFFWFMGDDDQVTHDSFIQIKNLLYGAGVNPDLILLRRIICDSAMNEVMPDECFKKPKEFYKITCEEDLADYLNNVKKTAGIFGLISSTIVSEKFMKFLDIELEKDEEWKGNLFPHVYLIFKYIIKNLEGSVRVFTPNFCSIKFRSGLVTKSGLLLKEESGNKINSLIDFEHLLHIAEKVFFGTSVHNPFRSLIRRLYTLGHHFNAIDNPNKKEREYHQYIFRVLFPDFWHRIYYKGVSNFLVFYRIYKKVGFAIKKR